MSIRDANDRLKFPSGLSVRQAKADAKQLKSQSNIKLHEAQRRIAADNGLNMSWGEAMETLKASGGNASEGFVVYCKRDGFISSIDADGPFSYTDTHQEAKVFSYEEIGQIYDALALDHPLSEAGIYNQSEAAAIKHITCPIELALVAAGNESEGPTSFELTAALNGLLGQDFNSLSRRSEQQLEEVVQKITEMEGKLYRGSTIMDSDVMRGAVSACERVRERELERESSISPEPF